MRVYCEYWKLDFLTTTFDEFAIRELFCLVAAEAVENKLLIQVTGETKPFLPNDRDYVVRSKAGWKGFNPSVGTYFTDPDPFR